MSFKTLPGFRAFYPEDCAKRDFIFDSWRKSARSFGFLEFDPPVLEQLELFTEKSGEEIKSQLFEFVDKGERAVSLRPEMTPSLARMVGERAAGIRRPVKWFAIGENYRYERQQKGRLRAFFQYNADILGEDSINADAEIIALLIESLRALGLSENEFALRLGDRKLWALFLQNEGVEEDRLIAVLSATDKLAKVSEEAFAEIVSDAVAGTGLDAKKLVERIRQFIAISDLNAMQEAFAGGALEQEANQRLSEWRTLLAILENCGLANFIKPDLGIVRGLAYYTGFVFEAFQTVGVGRALAGGGRYDNLVKKLGYQDMPAVGFGMGDVTVGDLLDLTNKRASLNYAPQVYVVIGSDAVRAVALDLIFAMRRAGIRVDYPLKQTGFGKQFKQADAVGAKYALVIGEDELSEGVAKLKNLSDASESKIALGEVCAKLLSELL